MPCLVQEWVPRRGVAGMVKVRIGGVPTGGGGSVVDLMPCLVQERDPLAGDVSSRDQAWSSFSAWMVHLVWPIERRIGAR